MSIKDLIKKLKQFDPESVVVLSADEEGNSFNKAQDIEGFLFKDGEICKEEELEDGHDWSRAIVLWP